MSFQLYSEVKARRQKGAFGPNSGAQTTAIRLSTHSGSTVSSTLTDSSEAHSSSYSDPLTKHRHSSTDSSHNYNEPNSQHYSIQCERSEQTSSGKYEHNELEAINTAELEDILHVCLVNKPISSGQNDLLTSYRGLQNTDINCATEKKKNTMALNAVSFLEFKNWVIFRLNGEKSVGNLMICCCAFSPS